MEQLKDTKSNSKYDYSPWSAASWEGVFYVGKKTSLAKWIKKVRFGGSTVYTGSSATTSGAAGDEPKIIFPDNHKSYGQFLFPSQLVKLL